MATLTMTGYKMHRDPLITDLLLKLSAEQVEQLEGILKEAEIVYEYGINDYRKVFNQHSSTSYLNPLGQICGLLEVLERPQFEYTLIVISNMELECQSINVEPLCV